MTDTSTKDGPQTKEVDGVKLEKWYVAPIWIPGEIREEITAIAKDHNMSLAEYVLVATIKLAGYDDDTANAARKLCYPKGKRTEPASETVKKEK